MFISFASIVFGFSLGALAAPSSLGGDSLAQRTSTTCGGLNGIAGFFDTTPNVTLSAWNRTLPNANDTGVPLVLVPIGETGGPNAVHLENLATFASVGINFWPTVALDQGTLIGNFMSTPADGGVPTFTVATQAAAGTALQFSSSSKSLPNNPIFCAVASTSAEGGGPRGPALAIGTDTDHFSLCQSQGPANLIIYQASATNDGSYDFNTCYPVTVVIDDLV
ncbi:hypothetical protein M422DRAFT_37091 [Sphaerobolus stellatus SS14]|uniref:Unplaced genomic scaffold SPHSTscaffold_216, whole genome shotgun sequence n=1 Tax=Sphaerobolus stellatus (strain SS14) TaxID=990650 RepID=A0A0C9UV55_SPHS4|nr:hypothetical protein M422DRAFT_37091 [Sphaerobolus stellatus SS14]